MFYDTKIAVYIGLNKKILKLITYLLLRYNIFL